MWTEYTDAGLSDSDVDHTSVNTGFLELIEPQRIAAPVEWPQPAFPAPSTRRPVDQSPPGWHRDPNGMELMRWWDGSSWTQHTSPASGAGVSTTVINIGSPKSVGVAFLLTFLFGPLGLLYSSVAGGVTMLVVELFLFILGFVTLGAAWLLFGFTWIACIIWGCVAASGTHRTQVVQTTNHY